MNWLYEGEPNCMTSAMDKQNLDKLFAWFQVGPSGYGGPFCPKVAVSKHGPKPEVPDQAWTKAGGDHHFGNVWPTTQCARRPYLCFDFVCTAMMAGSTGSHSHDDKGVLVE